MNGDYEGFEINFPLEEMLEMAKPDIVGNAEEAAKILVELAKTPQLRKIDFQFTMDMDAVPVVNYEIERFTFKQEVTNNSTT